MSLIDNLRAYLNSEEGKAETEKFFNKIENEGKIREYQLEKFHNKGNFQEFVEKVITKYQSDAYRDRWYNRHIEPPEDLFHFLDEYAAKYGRECTEDEYIKYGNTFTSTLYFCNGYYFNTMNGQGTIVEIIKQ